MSAQSNDSPTFEALATAGFEYDQALGRLNEADRAYDEGVESEGKPSYEIRPTDEDGSLTAHIVERDEHETLAVSYRRFTDSREVTRGKPFKASFFLLTTLGNEGFHQTGERAFVFHGRDGWTLDIPVHKLSDVEIIEKRGKEVVSRWVGTEALVGATAE